MSQSKAVAEKIHRFTLNLKKDNYEWVRKSAHKNRLSISQFINMAIESRKEQEKRA